MSHARSHVRGAICAGAVLFACACGKTPAPRSTGPVAAPSTNASSSAPIRPPSSLGSAAVLGGAAFALPGTTGPVTLDLLAYDRARDQVWVPVGDTGSVDVFTVATRAFTRVDGFATREREAHGRKRMMGPSAAAAGDGFVYVSDRASNDVCAVSDALLKKGSCVRLASAPDVIGYVATTKEVWVTTPKDRTIAVLDASQPAQPKPKLVVTTDGEPECYAFDERRGVFYTNLEDKNRTVAIDVKTHAVKGSWALDCSERGPRGVAVDSSRNFVFVACSDHVDVLDGSRGGAALGRLEAGAGVDAIAYDDATRRLYVAAATDARVTVAELNDQGTPAVVATGTTAPGARNAVVDSSGNVYVVDPKTARLLVLSPLVATNVHHAARR